MVDSISTALLMVENLIQIWLILTSFFKMGTPQFPLKSENEQTNLFENQVAIQKYKSVQKLETVCVLIKMASL